MVSKQEELCIWDTVGNSDGQSVTYFQEAGRLFKLNNESLASIKYETGLDVEQISSMSCAEQNAWIEKRANKKITFPNQSKSIVAGRGNPLLAKHKYRTLDDLNIQSKKLFGF